MIDLWTFFQQLVNFFVLMGVLIYLLYRPVGRMLTERQTEIERNLAQAQEDRTRAERLREQYESRLAAARNEATDVLERARRQGGEMREEIVADARREAERLVARAQRDMERERRRAESELQGHFADVALLAAERLVRTSLTDGDHRRLVEEALRELESARLGDSR